MELIEVSPIPSQSFGFRAGGNDYEISLRFINGDGPGCIMVYDLLVNDSPVCRGFRIEVGELLIPYRYQEVNGNLIFDIPVDQKADYREFGSTQNLYYLTAEETEAFRAN